MSEEQKPAGPGYDQFNAEMVVCTTCGGMVGFAYMTLHTRWHEVMERPPAGLPKTR